MFKKELIRQRVLFLAFGIFIWLSAGFFVDSVVRSKDSEHLQQDIMQAQSMVMDRIQRMQMAVGLALGQSQGDGDKKSSFEALALVRLKNGSLNLDQLVSPSSHFSQEELQDQLNTLGALNRSDHSRVFLWVAKLATTPTYMFSLFPYTFEDGENGWGLALTSLPSEWLEFPGQKDLFFWDQISQRMFMAYGGTRQGEDLGLSFGETVSPQRVGVKASGEEVMAWKEMSGTNLVLILKRSPSILLSGFMKWSLVSALFLLGLFLVWPQSKTQSSSWRRREPSPSSEENEEREEVVTPKVEEPKEEEKLPPSLNLEADMDEEFEMAEIAKIENAPKTISEKSSALKVKEETRSEIKEEDTLSDFNDLSFTEVEVPSSPMESVVEDQLLESFLSHSKPQASSAPEKPRRRAPAKVQPQNLLTENVSEALEGFKNEIQAEEVRVNLLIPEDLESSWPRTQLRTVLDELIRNSLEAMEGCETKTLTFTARDKGHQVELIVEDTGSGMTDEIKERALEAFFSTKPSMNKRRGLGLNVAKRLLDISKGSLEIESTPSIGTKITLCFPKEDLEETTPTLPQEDSL
ncbi:MAG: hypothetical protein CL676_08980 [Bdellovibrionaceae bacterium]|nr:hypothetical protein [Pseudobdellovibrionaceae bacterium]